MALPNYLAKIKSSGIYRFVWDKSEIPGEQESTLRLVVGYSEKGPFNTPVYIDSISKFRTVYGNISKKLERYGCFFHRLALQALASGPIIALNLKTFSDEDKCEGIALNPGDYLLKEGQVAGTFEYELSNIVRDIYNTDRFWKLEPEHLEEMPSFASKDKYIMLTHTDSYKASNTVFIRGFVPSNYNITFKEWYSSVLNGADMPDYITNGGANNDKDYSLRKLDQFFAEIYVFRGQFTKEICTSENLAKYFYIDNDDNVVLQPYILNAFGEKIDTLEALSQNSTSNFINKYQGILLPEFQSATNTILSLDQVFNGDFDNHKMMMRFNQSLLYAGTIDLDMLNTTGWKYEALSSNTRMMSVDLPSTHVYTSETYNGIDYSATDGTPHFYKYNNAKTVSNEPNKISIEWGGENMGFERGQYYLADVQDATLTVPHIAPYTCVLTDIEEGDDVSLLYGMTVNTNTNVTAENRIAMPRIYNTEETVTVSPDTYTRLISDVPFDGKTTCEVYAKDYSDTMSLPVQLYTYDGTDMSELKDKDNNNVYLYARPTAYTCGVYTIDLTDPDNPVYNLEGNCEILLDEEDTINHKTYYFFTKDSRDNEPLVCQRLHIDTTTATEYEELLDDNEDPLSPSLYMSPTGQITLTTKATTLTFDYPPYLNNNGIYRCNRSLTDTSEGVRPMYIEGYNQDSTYLRPHNTTQYYKNKWINDYILSALSDEDYKGIREALTNNVDSEWHYLVDTFEAFVEPECHAKLAAICKMKDNAFGLLNFPKIKSFSTCEYTSFTDGNNNFDMKYVAMGGNPSKPRGAVFSLASEENGASFVSYNTPVLIDDGTSGLRITVPAAGIVSNAYMRKYDNRFPYSIVAGPNYGNLYAQGLIGPDYNFSRYDKDILEPFGVNCTVYEPRKGTFINSNQTAKQNPVTTLSKINVRELVIFLQDEIEKLLQDYQWEFNTQTLRDTVKSRADVILEKAKSNGGLYKYLSVCDLSNNTEDVINNEMLVLSVSIEPGLGAGKMVQEITIYRYGGMTSVTR